MIEEIYLYEIKKINKATEQIHVASQFLSMAGKFLVQPEDDDSHTNLGWLSLRQKFISHAFGDKEKYYLSLHPETLTIGILDNQNHMVDSISLKRLTQNEATKSIKQKLKSLKIPNAKKYKIDLHYDMPEYANFEGKKFKISPKKAFKAFGKLRTWAEHYLNKYKISFPMASSTRTWPHHFDHASYIPLEKSKSGEVSMSISLGLAIHDGMINEPYFYISAWQKDKTLDLSKLKDLSFGYWLNEDFKGAVLPISNVFATDDHHAQLSKIDGYFSEAIAQLLSLINYKSKKDGK